MRSGWFRLLPMFMLLSSFFAQLFFAPCTAAQVQRSASASAHPYVAMAQKNKQAKTGKGTASADVWTDPAVSASPAHTTHTSRKHTPPRPKVPLLTIEWRVLKCEATGQQEEISPLATFNFNDRMRLAIKINQTGYLYIINQTEGLNGDILYGPKLIFPDTRILGGQNIMQKNQEIVLPPVCPPSSDPCGCTWRLTDTPGRETVILIFSREQLLDLAYNRLSNGLLKSTYIDQLKTTFSTRIARQEIKRTSRPDSIPQAGGPGRYAFWVTNYNRRNNEDLIEIISLTNAGRSSSD